MVDMIEEEKFILDSHVNQGRFAYVILKNRYYNNLEQSFAKFNQDTKDAIL